MTIVDTNPSARVEHNADGWEAICDSCGSLGIWEHDHHATRNATRHTHTARFAEITEELAAREPMPTAEELATRFIVAMRYLFDTCGELSRTIDGWDLEVGAFRSTAAQLLATVDQVERLVGVAAANMTPGDRDVAMATGRALVRVIADVGGVEACIYAEHTSAIATDTVWP